MDHCQLRIESSVHSSDWSERKLKWHDSSRFSYPFPFLSGLRRFNFCRGWAKCKCIFLRGEFNLSSITDIPTSWFAAVICADLIQLPYYWIPNYSVATVASDFETKCHLIDLTKMCRKVFKINILRGNDRYRCELFSKRGMQIKNLFDDWNKKISSFLLLN